MHTIKLIFKQGRFAEIFSVGILGLFFVIISISLLYALTLSVDRTLTMLFVLFGIYIAIIGSLIKRVKNRNYYFEIDENNKVTEHIKGDVNKEINFRTILGVKNLAPKTQEPVVKFYGTGVNGEDLEFTPIYIPNLTKMFLKLKEAFPYIVIDENFSRHVEIFKHKKIFGSYDPYLMFLFIVLLIGILGVPVVFILEFFFGK